MYLIVSLYVMNTHQGHSEIRRIHLLIRFGCGGLQVRVHWGGWIGSPHVAHFVSIQTDHWGASCLHTSDCISADIQQCTCLNVLVSLAALRHTKNLISEK